MLILLHGPAAGSEPAAPPEAGDATQSNDGAGFFGLVSVLQRWHTEEACPSLPAVRWDFPSKLWRDKCMWVSAKRGYAQRIFYSNRRSTVSFRKGAGIDLLSVIFAFPSCEFQFRKLNSFIRFLQPQGCRGMLP